MSFRNLIIENPAKITVKNKQLVINTDTKHSAALEDISAVLLESRQSTITTSALSQLGQYGCAVFICDEKHLPCAVLTPYHQHSRELSVLKSQMEAGKPLQKRLWQLVVKEKIKNQALCLQYAGKTDESKVLTDMSERVLSGDKDNIEASAAQYYFPALFGKNFRRSTENGYNSALNYGYAILRGFVARTLAVYGFLPTLGIQHHNILNQFNLADDLMEPFRPVIDLLVFRYTNEDDELTSENKKLLFNCLNLDILSGGQHHSISYAIEREIQSFGRALIKKHISLTLPELIGTEQHYYE